MLALVFSPLSGLYSLSDSTALETNLCPNIVLESPLSYKKSGIDLHSRCPHYFASWMAYPMANGTKECTSLDAYSYIAEGTCLVIFVRCQAIGNCSVEKRLRLRTNGLLKHLEYYDF